MKLDLWWDRAFGLPVTGTIIAKHDYNAMAASYKFKSGTQTVSAIESYSLVVRGETKHGNIVEREIYVSGLEFNTSRVGDAWPQPK